MRVIAFFTPAYEPVIANLRESLELVGVPHTLQARADAGTWVANCAQKPFFIREMFQANPGEQLLYIDADAVVHEDPRPHLWPAKRVDLGCHFRHRPKWDAGHYELLSGTLLINPTPVAAELLDRWCCRQEENPAEWDQKSLQHVVLHVMQQRLRLQRFPPTMTFIFDTMRQDHPQAVPIIEHFQASRKLRTKAIYP